MVWRVAALCAIAFHGASLAAGGGLCALWSEGETVGVRTKLLVALLHRVLQKEGAIGAAAAGGDYEQAQLRLAAGKALLKSSRISDVKIKPAPAEAWRAIALTMQVTGCHRHHHLHHLHHHHHHLPPHLLPSFPMPHLLHTLPRAG